MAPEAAAAERGTPARLRQLCNETQGIRLGDLTTLYTFRRSFLAEARKLTKPPTAMSNRELVELFIGSLSMAEKSQLKEGRKTGMILTKSSVESASERKVLLYNPVSDNNKLTQKLEELENIQSQEKDKAELANKSLDLRFTELEKLIKTLFVQGKEQGQASTENPGWRGKQYDPNSGVKLGMPGGMPKWGGNSKGSEGYGCFYCGGKDHFIPECEEMKEDVKNGLVKMNADGKLRLSDGSFIPNIPSQGTIKEKVMRHYASLPTTRPTAQLLNTSEDPVSRRARLERELELKEREEALELREGRRVGSCQG